MKARGVAAYPTRRAVLLACGCVLLAVVVGAVFPGRWVLGFIFAAAPALFLLADLALAGNSGGLTVEVTAPSRLAQGEESELRVKVGFSDGPPPGLEAAVTFSGRIVVAPRTRPVGDTLATFRLRAVGRGRASLDAVQVRWTGPLGLLRRRRDVVLASELFVTPDLSAARASARSLGADAVGGPKVDVRRGAGGEFRALRAYQDGDERRLIDWKRSAARGGLLVKEFQLEQNHPMVLALDCGRQMMEPVGGRPRLDQALSAALALGYAGLAVGDRVRLCGFGATMQAASGFVSERRSFAGLAAVASQLDSTPEATNYTLALHTIAGELDRRSLVVIFTEFTDTIGAELMLESVARLIRRHVVMFVIFKDEELESIAASAPEDAEDIPRAVVAASLLRERELVLERLKRMGVRAVETTPNRMGGAIIDAYLDLKRREAM